MKTLLIGDMERMESFYSWLEYSEESFEIDTIISENQTVSQCFSCDIRPVSDLKNISTEYDIFFICSSLYDKYVNLLKLMGVNPNSIKPEDYIYEYLPPKYRMEYYKKKVNRTCWGNNQSGNITIGDYTYAAAKLRIYNDNINTTLNIGKFCSLGTNIAIMLGGNHRDDWCTTYPFNFVMKEFSYIKGHPKSNGNVIIGNDVWIGNDAKIMSGVSIGDGSIIAANACVTKNVEPYTIVGGVPAKKIRKRFSDDIIEKLLEIKWWDWDDELIYQVIPLLQSSSFQELFQFYQLNVK